MDSQPSRFFGPGGVRNAMNARDSGVNGEKIGGAIVSFRADFAYHKLRVVNFNDNQFY